MNTIEKYCRECGKTFSITPKQSEFYKFKGLSDPSRCESCRRKKRTVEYFTCKNCGEFFGLNELEKEWYQKNGYALPKRCNDCRKKRREQNGHRLQKAHS